MSNRITRRQFVQHGAFMILAAGSARTYAANEKLNIGIIGLANRGKANLNGVAAENIVALCDVDSNFLEHESGRFPRARQYTDFRRMIGREKLDALVVSTPDHTHAVATAAGLHNGLHIYCEKPLTRTVPSAVLSQSWLAARNLSRKWAHRFTPERIIGVSSSYCAPEPSAK